MVEMLAEKRLAWRNRLSAEDQAKLVAEKAAWAAEETKGERMAEFDAAFAAADTNSDGLLDRAEFEDFMTKLGLNAEARGCPHQPDTDYTADEKNAIYDLFNGKTAGADGVTTADFFAVMQDVGAKVQELSGN